MHLEVDRGRPKVLFDEAVSEFLPWWHYSSLPGAAVLSTRVVELSLEPASLVKVEWLRRLSPLRIESIHVVTLQISSLGSRAETVQRVWVDLRDVSDFKIHLGTILDLCDDLSNFSRL